MLPSCAWPRKATAPANLGVAIMAPRSRPFENCDVGGGGGAPAPLHGLAGHWNRGAPGSGFGGGEKNAEEDPVRSAPVSPGTTAGELPTNGRASRGGVASRSVGQRGRREAFGSAGDQPVTASPRAHRAEQRGSNKPWSTSDAANLRPNVRAEATHEVGRPWAAQDNGACDCPARPKGGTPRGVASRARG
jgi:hypothetical protein